MSNENEPSETWLSEYSNNSVREGNRQRFSVFLEWVKKSPSELVKTFDKNTTKSLVLQYQNFLLNEKGLNQNSTRTYVNSVRAFYSSQCEPLRLKGKIVKVQLPTNEHTFSTQDLRTMYSVGDLRDKAMLSLSCSLGWESSAFLNIEKSFIKALIARARANSEEFIAFDWQRKKTDSVQYGILTPMALFSCEQYIAKLDKEAPNQEKLFDIGENGLNKSLKSLCEKANIALIGKVRFHLLRKWLMNVLTEAGLSSFETKLILGKAINASDLTYLQTLKKTAFEHYKKAYVSHLSLSQMVNGTAKYSELLDLVIKHIKAQSEVTEYLKNNGLLKQIPSELQNKLAQVQEFASIMEKKNGDKPKEEPKKEEERNENVQ